MDKFDALSKLREVQSYIESISEANLSSTDKSYALEHLERTYLTIQRVVF